MGSQPSFCRSACPSQVWFPLIKKGSEGFLHCFSNLIDKRAHSNQIFPRKILCAFFSGKLFYFTSCDSLTLFMVMFKSWHNPEYERRQSIFKGREQVKYVQRLVSSLPCPYWLWIDTVQIIQIFVCNVGLHFLHSGFYYNF